MRQNNKIVLLGESTVGKSTITARLGGKDLDYIRKATVGAEFNIITLDDTKFNVWDTAGQEKYRSLVPSYYRDANIVLMVFDYSHIGSKNEIHYYLNKIMEILSEHQFIIIGNKIDLVDETTITFYEKLIKRELEEYEIYDKFTFLNISALTGEGFDELKQAIISKKSNVSNNHQNNLSLPSIGVKTINRSCNC